MKTIVDEVCRTLEATSGKPVILQPDPDLKLIARITIARGAAPGHVLTYNPKYGEATDYHIVFQCGLALRTYETPSSDRFDVASTEAGRREAGELVADHLRRSGINLPGPALDQFKAQLYDGIILQLRSVPVGLRVDHWVRETYPTLDAQQRSSAVRQLAENQGALAPQMKAIAPDKIYRANLGMNAALALFWGRTLGDVTAAAPYKIAGFLDLGEELLRAADATPPDPSADRSLIERWGGLLGLTGWFALIPFGG